MSLLRPRSNSRVEGEHFANPVGHDTGKWFGLLLRKFIHPPPRDVRRQYVLVQTKLRFGKNEPIPEAIAAIGVKGDIAAESKFDPEAQFTAREDMRIGKPRM